MSPRSRAERATALLLTLALVLPLAGPAAAAAPTRLARTSDWQVQYMPDSCRVGARFGDGDGAVLLLLDRPDDSQPSLLVVGDRVAKRGMTAATLRLSPDGLSEPVEGQAVMAGKVPGYYWSDLDLELRDRDYEKIVDADETAGRATPIDRARLARVKAERMARAGRVERIELSPLRRGALVLETGSLAPPLAMLDQCYAAQQPLWGIDAATEDRIAVPAYGNLQRLFSSKDYPGKALRDNYESRVEARVHVDATGKPTRCTPTSLFSDPEFGKVACAKIMGATFRPATLADGTAVASVVMTTIRFKLK